MSHEQRHALQVDCLQRGSPLDGQQKATLLVEGGLFIVAIGKTP